jgi:hypothetical protein
MKLTQVIHKSQLITEGLLSNFISNLFFKVNGKRLEKDLASSDLALKYPDETKKLLASTKKLQSVFDTYKNEIAADPKLAELVSKLSKKWEI